MNDERDEFICRQYEAGATMVKIASDVGVSRQVVLNVLKRAGKWQSRARRSEQVRIHLPSGMKATLEIEANRRGMPTSRLIANILAERSIQMKTAKELITDEFLERMLEDIKFKMPKMSEFEDEAGKFSRRAQYRRFLRDALLERLQPMEQVK